MKQKLGSGEIKLAPHFDGAIDMGDNLCSDSVPRAAAPPGPGHPKKQGLKLGQRLPARTELRHRSHEELARAIGPAC